jgi:hypothetical protein
MKGYFFSDIFIQSLITKVLVRVCFNTCGITFERDCEGTLPEILALFSGEKAFGCTWNIGANQSW